MNFQKLKLDLEKVEEEGKESACNAGDLDLIPESGRFPWRRERLLTSAFLSGNSMDREA